MGQYFSNKTQKGKNTTSVKTNLGTFCNIAYIWYLPALIVRDLSNPGYFPIQGTVTDPGLQVYCVFLVKVPTVIFCYTDRQHWCFSSTGMKGKGLVIMQPCKCVESRLSVRCGCLLVMCHWLVFQDDLRDDLTSIASSAPPSPSVGSEQNFGYFKGIVPTKAPEGVEVQTEDLKSDDGDEEEDSSSDSDSDSGSDSDDSVAPEESAEETPRPSSEGQSSSSSAEEQSNQDTGSKSEGESGSGSASTSEPGSPQPVLEPNLPPIPVPLGLPGLAEYQDSLPPGSPYRVLPHLPPGLGYPPVLPPTPHSPLNPALQHLATPRSPSQPLPTPQSPPRQASTPQGSLPTTDDAADQEVSAIAAASLSPPPPTSASVPRSDSPMQESSIKEEKVLGPPPLSSSLPSVLPPHLSLLHPGVLPTHPASGLLSQHYVPAPPPLVPAISQSAGSMLPHHMLPPSAAHTIPPDAIKIEPVDHHSEDLSQPPHSPGQGARSRTPPPPGHYPPSHPVLDQRAKSPHSPYRPLSPAHRDIVHRPPSRSRSRSRSPIVRDSDSDPEDPPRSPSPEPRIIDEECHRSDNAM